MRFSNQWGWYELNPFPGSNQIVVSNHAFIYPEFRGTGKGQEQHVERLKQAKSLGYDIIMCTVRTDNVVERHILLKNGWGFLQRFRSTETGHELDIFSKRLDNG